MSGILDSKQRIIDFIFTRNGYSQIQNNDIRIVYASLSDGDAIYETKDGEINVADTNVNPFLFESYSKYTDTMNTEIDLSQTNIFSIKTDLNNKLYDISNNISQKNIQIEYIDSLFSNVNKKLISNMSDECVLLSHDYLNYDKEKDKIKPIEITLTQINNQNTPGQSIEDSLSIPLILDNNNTYETVLHNNSINMDRYTMMSDERFQYKLNYLFLPPSNMKTDTVVLNRHLRNDYILNEDSRDKNKILIKNSNTPIRIQNGTFDNIVLKTIEYLERQSNAEQEPSISKISFTFEQFEHDSEFLISLFEKSTDSNGLSIFNKLLFVNHGEIYDLAENKNKQVYSAGKLYQTKTSSVNSNDNTNETVEDNYVFINLFTIVIK